MRGKNPLMLSQILLWSLIIMIQWQEKFSFVPLTKYNYTPSAEELKSAESNFKEIKGWQGQLKSSWGLLNVNGDEKLIEVVAVDSKVNYLVQISKLDYMAKMFGWKVFITMNPHFGKRLL